MYISKQSLLIFYLCVQAQENEHDKETDGPQLREGHHGYSLRICNERQAWTWKVRMNTRLITFYLLLMYTMKENIDK